MKGKLRFTIYDVLKKNYLLDLVQTNFREGSLHGNVQSYIFLSSLIYLHYTYYILEVSLTHDYSVLY